MSSNDEQLRLAYGTLLAERGAAARGSHPEPEALLAVVERSGSESVRLEILDHVMACDACRRELDLLRASVAATGVPRQRSWFRSPSAGLVALAATLLVAASVRMYVASKDVEAGPRLRGGGAVATYAARWTPATGAVLSWRPLTGAANYRLELVDEAGVAVVDTMMRDTSLVVADSLLLGKRGLVWSVTATLNDGGVVSSSPLRLEPPRR